MSVGWIWPLGYHFENSGVWTKYAQTVELPELGCNPIHHKPAMRP